MSKTDEIALARMTAEVSPAMARMIAAEGGVMAGVRADARRINPQERPPVLPDRDAARAHDAEAAAEAQRRARRDAGGPTVLGPQDRQRMAPRGF
jgi:hypothetical protein